MRRTLILAAAVALIILGVLGWMFMQNREANRNQNTNTPVEARNANTTTVSTPPVVKGDLTVDQTVAYRDLTFRVDTALKDTKFHRTQAPTGMTYVVLFLKPFGSVPSDNPLAWATQDIRLLTGKKSIVPTELNLPMSAEATGGYLWFTVSESDQDFSLSFGTGTAAKKIELGF